MMFFIKNGVLNFEEIFYNEYGAKKNSFYTILLEDFFNLNKENQTNIWGKKKQVKPIESIKELPEPTKTINLIEPQDYAFPQEYI